MDKETKPNRVEPGQSPVENENLPDDGELQEDELDEVSGGSVKLISQMVSDMAKLRSDVLMSIARNLK